ncbi:CU044_2847 family protein [Streptomyces iakyrus]|uniref:CU044_2847 family protein n=1 Tax=Streptomyces iakyrus TaxID=68219 RepID=UPI0036EF352F
MRHDSETGSFDESRPDRRARTVEVRLPGGGFLEVQAAPGGAARDIADTGGSFDQAMASLRGVAEATLAVLRDVAPDEATVEFGMNVRAKTGQLVGFLVSADTGADLKVTMTWRKAHDITGPDPA